MFLMFKVEFEMLKTLFLSAAAGLKYATADCSISKLFHCRVQYLMKCYGRVQYLMNATAECSISIQNMELLQSAVALPPLCGVTAYLTCSYLHNGSINLNKMFTDDRI